MEKKQTELQSFLVSERKGALKRYLSFTVGKGKWLTFIKYEILIGLFGSLSGALGLLLRAKFYPHLLGKVGRNVTFGRNVTIRHPKRITIGDNVLIDDNCVLDARGESGNGIVIGKGVIIGRNTIISMKDGTIEIGENSNIGVNCTLHTSTNLRLGKNIIIAAYTYLIAGGNHKFDRTDIPIIAQGIDIKGGIVIENNCWLGAGVMVLDGTRIERDTIIGAGAVVNKNIPEFSIAVGMPARVIKRRR